MKKLDHIDSIMANCGYSHGDFRCKHPECDDIDDNGKGLCFARSCPLGYCAEREDFISFGEDPEGMTEGEWLVVEEKEAE